MSALPPDTAETMPAGADWTRHPERSNAAMLRLMTWLSLRLGRRASRGVLALVSLYFLLFAPSARHASRAYLGRALSRKPGLADLYRHFHSFAGTVHDRIYLLNDRFDLFDIEVEGEALFDEVLAAGRGVFLMGAHLGSFEVVRAVGRDRRNLRVAMVMYEENARKINAALQAINPAAAQDVIPLGKLDSMLLVRDRLDEGAAIGLLADRTPGDEATLTLPYLGAEAAFPLGPMRLAAMLKRPVLFMTGLYRGGNRYVIRFERIADFSETGPQKRDEAVREAVAIYASCLERHCRAHPYNWFNFFDFWSTRPD